MQEVAKRSADFNQCNVYNVFHVGYREDFTAVPDRTLFSNDAHYSTLQHHAASPNFPMDPSQTTTISVTRMQVYSNVNDECAPAIKE